MRHALTNLGLVTALGLAGGAMIAVISSSPAFNSDLRRSNELGDFSGLFGRDMYQLPSYLSQQAATLIRADVLPYDDGTGEFAIAPLDVFRKRAQQAITFAQDSLALAPANANTWSILAWAHVFNGAPEESRAALSRSWELAPYDLALAEDRLPLALTLFDPAFSPQGSLVLSATEQTGIMRDFETLWVQRIGRYNQYAPRFTELGLPIYVSENGPEDRPEDTPVVGTDG